MEGGRHRLTIQRQDGERLDVEIRSHFGIRLALSAVLRPGFCLMQGDLLTVGMAARPEGARTRFAHFALLRLPGAAVLRPLLRHRIHHELEALERLARGDRHR